MYDYKTCECSEAAWKVTGKTESGEVPMMFGAWVTEDEYSPNGFGWYFASYQRDEGGQWSEWGGGIYWDYLNASDLEHVIGDTLPLSKFSYERMDYADFEAVAFGGDKEAESRLFGELLTSALNTKPKEQLYSVRITETLERTVQVKATSRDEAKDKVADGWKHESHVLGAEDFKGVDFKVTATERSRPMER